jgi:hypothetical protein
VGMGDGSDYFFQMYDQAGTVSGFLNSAGAVPAAGTWLYGSVTYSGTGATSWSAYNAPQLYSSAGGYTNTYANNPLSGATNLYLGAIGGTPAVNIYYNWDRARLYPPNGVMPTGAFGATVANPATACLITAQFTSGSTLYAGTWFTDLWASALASGAASVSIYITNSAGIVVSTVLSGGTSGTVGTTKGEVKTPQSGAAGTVPTSGYVEVVLTAPSTGPLAFTIYWGTGQLSNFDTPSTYNYVLAIVNSASTAWNINLATAGTPSNIGRLTATISFVSPASNQIIVTSGSLTQASGAVVSLAGSGTVDIEVVATANSLPTATNTPSTITFVLDVASTTTSVYALYTVVLTLN